MREVPVPRTGTECVLPGAAPRASAALTAAHLACSYFGPDLWAYPGAYDDTWDFDAGSLVAGEEDVLRLELRNAGDVNLEIRALSWHYATADEIETSRGPAFTCSYGDDDLPCGDPGGLPVCLASHLGEGEPKALSLRIRFRRQDDERERKALLTIDSDDRNGERTLLFWARRLTPEAVVRPSRVEFSALPAGASETAYVTVRNAGTAPLVLDELRWTADPTLRLGSSCATPLPWEETAGGLLVDPPIVFGPREAGRLAVIYAPVGPKGAEGFLEIHTNDPDTPWHTVPIEAAPYP